MTAEFWPSWILTRWNIGSLEYNRELYRCYIDIAYTAPKLIKCAIYNLG